FAEPVLGHREEVALRVVRHLGRLVFRRVGLGVVLDDRTGGEHVHLDDVIVLAQPHHPNTGGAPPHWANLFLVEADYAAAGLPDEDVGVTVREAHGIQIVAFGDVDRDVPAGA